MMQRLLLAVTLGCAALAAAAQVPLTGKFGFVNTERILREAVPAQRAQKKIEAEFQKRDQELAKIAEQLKRMQDDLDRNSVTMGEAQRRNREREFADLEDFTRRKTRHVEVAVVPVGLLVAGDTAASADRRRPSLRVSASSRHGW